MLDRLKKILLDILFPLTCCGCGASDTLLCTDCKNSLPFLYRTISNPAPNLDFAVICLNYESPIVRALIHQFKYGGIIGVAEPLGAILRQGLARVPHSGPFTLMPIPLHKRKRRIRGFNQSELLARKLAAASALTLDHGLLRKRFTRSQAKLSRQERLRNLKNSFRYSGARSPERVLLIDDVATTFSTLDEAARELKKAGIKTIGALVVAKNEDMSAP